MTVWELLGSWPRKSTREEKEYWQITITKVTHFGEAKRKIDRIRYQTLESRKWEKKPLERKYWRESIQKAKKDQLRDTRKRRSIRIWISIRMKELKQNEVLSLASSGYNNGKEGEQR